MRRSLPVVIRENIVEEVKATVRSVASAVLPADDTDDALQAAIREVRPFLLGALQVLGLWELNFAGVWLVARTALPIPGNLVGMVALYALLAVGIVKLTWFETAGSFLVKHLAFFFVPITVGLMDADALIATRGVAIILILSSSAGIGILLAGGVSQCLLRKSSHIGGRT